MCGVIDSQGAFLGELNIQLTEFSLKKKKESDTWGKDTSIINIYISFYTLLSEASGQALPGRGRGQT